MMIDPRTGKQTEQHFRFADVATKSLHPPKPSERLAAWILKLDRLPKPFNHWQPAPVTKPNESKAGVVLPFSNKTQYQDAADRRWSELYGR